MKFLNDEHRTFYYKVMNMIKQYRNSEEIGSNDKSFVYILGLCDLTREHINEIYSLNKGLNIAALELDWQTEISLKVTRLAFNVYAEWIHDTTQEAIENRVSKNYSVNEIFDCDLAPYFLEAIKIRFPRYFREEKTKKQDDGYKSWKLEKIEDITNKEVAGLYIRTCNQGEKAEEIIYKQIELLEHYCNNNNIENTIMYIDTDSSGINYERDAFQEMIHDIKNKKIQKLIITEASKLHREPNKIISLMNEKFMKDVEVISIDCSIENIINAKNNLKKYLEIEAKKIVEDEESI